MRILQAWRRGPDRLAPALFRAEEWWEFKLVPAMTCLYATALLLNAPLLLLWPSMLMLIAAIAPAAVYTSVINDITDRRSDAAAGQANRSVGVPAIRLALAVAAPLAVGIWWCRAWRADLPLLGAYLGSWVAFSLYSLPPFRLKARGGWGMLADAAGANLFPALVGVLLARRQLGQPADAAWLWIIAGWSGAWGLRGILWHQLQDAAHDRLAGVATFVQRRSPAVAAGVAGRLIFPLELAALSLLLWWLHDPWVAASLPAYAGLVLVRLRGSEPWPVVVAGDGNRSLWLQEYYEVLLPAGMLLAAAVRHPADIAVACLHFLLFPRRALGVAGALKQVRSEKEEVKRVERWR